MVLGSFNKCNLINGNQFVFDRYFTLFAVVAMKKGLVTTIAKVRVISGSKSSGCLDEIQEQVKDRFKNRIKSASRPSAKTSSTQVKVPVNDDKIARDLSFLQDMLQLLADEYEQGNLYRKANEIIDLVVEGFKDESDIVECFERNKKLYRYLSNKWTKDKEDFQGKLHSCDEKIFDLENEIREVLVENDIKSRLVLKWEQARLEHTEGRFNEERSEIAHLIQKAKSDYDKELRIYNEVEIFTRSEIERLRSLSDEWELRYSKECSELDEEIKSAKVQIEKTQDRIQCLREIFIRRNIEIQSYLQQKAQMEEARRLEKLKWDSAVRIQAWWRGTMFRNCLGPYRKKKKAPKKGKGGRNK